MFALAGTALGQPLPAAAQTLSASIEADIETADESNDKLVEGEQAVTAAIAHDAAASARSAQRLVVDAARVWPRCSRPVVSFLISRPLVRAARGLLAAARGIAAGDLDQRVDVRAGGELGADRRARSTR